jgi:hypothetical protein
MRKSKKSRDTLKDNPSSDYYLSMIKAMEYWNYGIMNEKLLIEIFFIISTFHDYIIPFYLNFS